MGGASVPPPPPPPPASPVAGAADLDPASLPVERVDEEWGTMRGAPPSKAAPERAGKPLAEDHFAYIDDRRPLAYRGAWRVGMPDLAPRAGGGAARRRRLLATLWPRGGRRYAVAALVVAFVGVRYADAALVSSTRAMGEGEEQVHLLLGSQPGGCKVAVDGNDLVPVTPLSEYLSLPPGPHSVTFRCAGHEPLTRDVELKPGQHSLVMRESIERGGTVNVVSTPPGAKVWLDGKEQGTSPLALDDVTFDAPHQLLLRLDGHEERAVALPRDRPAVHAVEVDLPLQGELGRVELVTHPSAELYIDGLSRGMTKVGALELSVGRHDVRFVVPGLGIDTSVAVTVPESGTARYFFDLSGGATQ